ncbi:MAG TPA: hypothetical protein VGH02_06925 [Rhizomicrobium sp.]
MSDDVETVRFSSEKLAKALVYRLRLPKVFGTPGRLARCIRLREPLPREAFSPSASRMPSARDVEEAPLSQILKGKCS